MNLRTPLIAFALSAISLAASAHSQHPHKYCQLSPYHPDGGHCLPIDRSWWPLHALEEDMQHEALIPDANVVNKMNEVMVLATSDNRIIRVLAKKPAHILSQTLIYGMAKDEHVASMDFRVDRGVLYAVSNYNRLFTINQMNGKATLVGGVGPLRVDELKLGSGVYGLNFNPVADRIRIAGPDGFNARVHPDTGAWVDSDPTTPGIQVDGTIHYASESGYTAQFYPHIGAVAYTYNKSNSKITTNYAVDVANKMLVRQGSKEGQVPAVSPNTGALYPVGPLVLTSPYVHMDISDVNNFAFLFTYHTDTRNYQVQYLDLNTAKQYRLGFVTAPLGTTFTGMAIEP